MNSLYISTHTSQQIWPDFIAHFQSETTMASYQTDLDEFMNYIEKDFTKATESDVKAYYEHLVKKVKQGIIKPGTMAKKMRECHSFAEHICANRERYRISETFQDYFYSYLKLVAKQEKFAKAIPVEHIDRLLNMAQRDKMVYNILILLYRVGLSSTEIIELKVQDLEEYADGYYIWVDSRNEAVFLPEDVIASLSHYLLERGDNEYLFYNRQGNKLNTMYISRMMKKYTTLADLPSYSAEMLRNSCAFTMYAYGAGDKQVAAQLGISQMQIKRYKNQRYKNNIQKQAQSLVKLKVEPPK